jgi:glutathione S-transferase
MPNKLYVVDGSHPCVTVERALTMKGIPYKTIELPPPMHAPVARALFGKRTVPAIKFEDGTKVSGSREILLELERRVPEPSLYPADADARAAVLEAERWGDEVLQAVARRVLWPALQRSPKSLPSFTANAKIPLPGPVVVASAPLLTRVERRMNAATEAATRADLLALPSHLDKIDAWIADGTLGSVPPNAADLQILPSVNLLTTVGDVRPLIEGRPVAELLARTLPPAVGSIPAGVYPADWLPAPTAVPANA